MATPGSSGGSEVPQPGAQDLGAPAVELSQKRAAGDFDLNRYRDQAVRAGEMHDTLTSGAGQSEPSRPMQLPDEHPTPGKPLQDADNLRMLWDRMQDPKHPEAGNEFFYAVLEELTPEQREQVTAGAREHLKEVFGVKDTADLSEDAKKAWSAMEDWLMLKMRR